MKNIVENQGIKNDKPVPLSYEQLKQRLDAVVAENVALREIIHPIANQNTDVECTDRPVWYVCNPQQMMSPSASALCHMFHGPFWSRERAEEYLENTNYRYGNKASVFCKSLYHYPEMRNLFDASKNLSTPATSAALAEVEAKAIEKFADTVGEMYQPEKPATVRARTIKHIVFLATHYAKELREAR